MEGENLDVAAVCKVEVVERLGCRAILLRLTGDGEFHAVLEPLKALVREHAPALGADGLVDHFLIFDLTNVDQITEALIGLFALGIKHRSPAAFGGIRRIVPAVALLSDRSCHLQIIQMVKFHQITPVYADERAAFAAMTPCGFSESVNYVRDRLRRGAARDAQRVEQSHQAPETTAEPTPVQCPPPVGLKNTDVTTGGLSQQVDPSIWTLAKARRVFHELEAAHALDFGKPEVMEFLCHIIQAAEYHGDWDLYFAASWHEVHILSLENSIGSMWRSAERAMDKALSLGDVKRARGFRTWMNDAERRESRFRTSGSIRLWSLLALCLASAGLLGWLLVKLFFAFSTPGASDRFPT